MNTRTKDEIRPLYLNDEMESYLRPLSKQGTADKARKYSVGGYRVQNVKQLYL